MRALKRVSAATRTGHLLSGIGAICADVLLLVAAFTALPWLIAATAALSVTVRVLTWRRSAAIAEAFSRFLIANLYRSIFRDAAVAVALVRVGVDGRVLASAAGAILVVWLAALCTDVAAAGLRRLGPAVLTRNITIDGAHRATAPASYWPAPRVLDLNVVVLCGVAVSLLTGIASVLYAASIVTAAAGILAACAVVVALLRVGGGQRDHPGVAANAVAEALNRLGPQVVLYSPGEARDSYQVAMWLGTLAQLKEPAVVVVRDRGMFASIGDTTLPVLCVPNTLDLVNLDLPTVRAVLYPGNFGDNVHMLRRPGLRHVFVGHGDSDKAASANPFTKVYDEVWVAAAAGRDRYAVADVGVDDKDIVEVGRPQLDAVAQAEHVDLGAGCALHRPVRTDVGRLGGVRPAHILGGRDGRTAGPDANRHTGGPSDLPTAPTQREPAARGPPGRCQHQGYPSPRGRSPSTPRRGFDQNAPRRRDGLGCQHL